MGIGSIPVLEATAHTIGLTGEQTHRVSKNRNKALSLQSHNKVQVKVDADKQT